MNTIVARIDELRKIKGLKKKALADKSGIPRSTVNNWYYADGIPSLTTLGNICVALEVTMEQFFSGLGGKKDYGAEKQFLDKWRMLTDSEKAAVVKVIAVFKEDKGGAK